MRNSILLLSFFLFVFYSCDKDSNPADEIPEASYVLKNVEYSIIPGENTSVTIKRELPTVQFVNNTNASMEVTFGERDKAVFETSQFVREGEKLQVTLLLDTLSKVSVPDFISDNHVIFRGEKKWTFYGSSKSEFLPSNTNIVSTTTLTPYTKVIVRDSAIIEQITTAL